MYKKRSLVVALLGLNLLLLLVLLSAAYSLPAAYAGGGAKAGDFACVTAKPPGQNYDVLYLLDQSNDKLHAFYPARAGGKKYGYAYGKYRDLIADFGR
ncbi:MAG: hypothetical protein KJ749_10700 [Planctomycetes bacterium]|nr:hypothetical protein [Planctomycetota bacterium]